MHPHSFLILLAPATAFAASVHQQRDLSPAPASSLPSGWSYAGCAIDKVVPRSLASASTYSDDMTAAKCISFCSAQGYNVAGTEYGSECYCGLTIPSPAPAEAECNKPCAGDASQACGAGYRLSLYSNPGVATVKINPGTSGWTSLGCVADAASPRTLSDFTAVQGAMTVEGCIAACQAGSYSFAGLEYGRECWCGNTPNVQPANDPAQCFKPCEGDETSFCGGPWALNMYGAPTTPAPPASTCQPLRTDGYGLLQNGGFENGFAGWTPTVDYGDFDAGIDTVHELEGCNAATVAPRDPASPAQLQISQTLTTDLIPNAAYLFTGYQGRLPDSIDVISPTIAVTVGGKYLGTVTACKGTDGCEIAAQGGARYTKHTIPFVYTGTQTEGVMLTFTITWEAGQGGVAGLLFDGFNLVKTSTD